MRIRNIVTGETKDWNPDMDLPEGWLPVYGAEVETFTSWLGILVLILIAVLYAVTRR